MPQTTKYLLIAVLSGAVAACAGEKKAEPIAQAPAPVEVAPVEVEDTGPAEEVFEATPGLSARERFRKSIRLLETGQSGQAKAELEAYIAEVPNSSAAQGLLDQITTEVEDYFPEESFMVNLASGDSLSTLAKAYLGDPLKFYILSRYNELENPSQVTVGQTIKIPATEETLAAKEMIETQPAMPEPVEEPTVEIAVDTPAEAAPVPAEATGWDKVNGLAASGDYNEAAKTLEGMEGQIDRSNAVSAARILMTSATELGRTDALASASRSLMAGKLYMNVADQPEMALEALQLSTSLDPANIEAQELLSTAQATVADQHYREGLAAYRKQELDQAIASWDRVLEIDPEHANANLYRAQALDLKDRLSRMK
ncbi:MAG: tetratricopeptide repeat protein [Alphaproteobacteria bacterium]